ncbi:MAG: hypothetical protein QME74_01715, partial [Candidatus Edwardsbacteria bacterium]|nr:hypothetical protein [Candidatus Edwardsbacteria bacterium]
MRHIAIFITCLILSAGACCKRQVSGANAPALTVSRLAAKPAAFLDRSVTVSGRLKNAGGNYFTDLRIELVDEAGAAVAVQPWLPLSVPPP